MKKEKPWPDYPTQYHLDPGEPFPELSTNETFVFFNRGGRSFRLHLTVDVHEIGKPGSHATGYVGQISSSNYNEWYGRVGPLSEQGDDYCKGGKTFPETLENLIAAAGDTLDKDLQTLKRLAKQFNLTLPARLDRADRVVETKDTV